MGRGQTDDPKSDYRYDFFKPLYFNRSHYTLDCYCKEQDDKLYFLVEIQVFQISGKELLMIEERSKGELEIVSETGIDADLRKEIFSLIKEHSKYYGNK